MMKAENRNQMGARARVSGFCFLLSALCFAAPAADVAPGYVFTAGQSVSHVELNAAAAGTINTTFITGQTAVTAPDTAGLLILYDATASAFRKATLLNAVFNHDTLINGRSAGVPTNTDLVLFYSAGGTVYRKATLDALVFTNAYLLANKSNAPVVTGSFDLLGSSNGVYYRVAVSNLLTNLTASLVLSNLTLHTTPTNSDRLLIWDSVANSIKAETYAGFFTNAPNLTNIGTNLIPGGTLVALVDTNLGTVVKTTFSNLLFNATNGINYATTNDSGMAKAWVNFKGRGSNGTCTNNSAFNVALVTRTNTGHYIVTFTTAFADTNYVYTGWARRTAAADGIVTGDSSYSKTTSEVSLHVAISQNGVALDPVECSAIFFR